MSICRCAACKGYATQEGEALRACSCDPEHQSLQTIEEVPWNVKTVDLDSGVQNVYAQRIKRRLLADVRYLRLQATEGHGRAATEICAIYGHDARAGLCLRCGGRLGRSIEE